VAAALRQVGLDHETDFSKYHHVFNRATWSPLRLARRLLHLLIRIFLLSGGRLTFAIDRPGSGGGADASGSAATIATRWPPARPARWPPAASAGSSCRW
jgi:hypothetical protein